MSTPGPLPGRSGIATTRLPSRSLPQGERPGHGQHLRSLHPVCVKTPVPVPEGAPTPRVLLSPGTFGMCSLLDLDPTAENTDQTTIKEQNLVVTVKNDLENKIHENQYAAMGIRTPVVGVRVPHDWPVYTIAARAPSCSMLFAFVLLISFLRLTTSGSPADPLIPP